MLECTTSSHHGWRPQEDPPLPPPPATVPPLPPDAAEPFWGEPLDAVFFFRAALAIFFEAAFFIDGHLQKSDDRTCAGNGCSKVGR
jgi:hypothetical protein